MRHSETRMLCNKESARPGSRPLRWCSSSTPSSQSSRANAALMWRLAWSRCVCSIIGCTVEPMPKEPRVHQPVPSTLNRLLLLWSAHGAAIPWRHHTEPSSRWASRFEQSEDVMRTDKKLNATFKLRHLPTFKVASLTLHCVSKL